MIRAIRTAMVLLVLVAALAPAASLAQPRSEVALLEALSRVPATAGSLGAPISYVDYRAVAEARPGALVPSSLADLLARHEADDPAAALWFAASMGIASGPSELLIGLLRGGPSWPESIGFDFADIERAVAFGEPPADGTVLLGDFDPEVVRAAYEARDYAATPANGGLLLCGAGGCDAGTRVDPERIDPSVPFGGRLGRQQPLVVSSTEILSSADIGTVEDMLASIEGEAPSLAALPAFEALASATQDDRIIVQATFLPPPLVLGGPDLAGMIGATPEQVEAILAEFEALEPMPMPLAVAIIDGATSTEQVLTVALSHMTQEDASQAAEAVAERLGSVRSLVRDVPLTELLEDRGVTSVTSAVLSAAPDLPPVATVELRAPLAGEEPDASGRLAPSSALYRLFIDMIFTRDLLWLTPSG